MTRLCRLFALLIWLPLAAVAQPYPQPLSDLVNDYAGLLDADTATRISANLQAARDETGVHIVLATIERQADYGGTGRFADFATGWFNAWGIGDAARDDGILILVGRSDREMRIVLGDAYDVIWDGRAQRVIDTAMLPEFRNDAYAAGLEAGVQAAIDRLARPYAAKEQVTETSGFPKESNLFLWLGLGVFGVVFGRIAAAVAFPGAFSRLMLRLRRCPTCRERALAASEIVQVRATETEAGRGVHRLHCTHCGSDRDTGFDIPSHSAARAAQARSSSSSSGFGGGGSSGGGASGRW